MSLNGLDDVKIKEAHDAAVAEPGGWVLLKYAARDEIELLSRGNGGIVEIRNTIASYEEVSPLFGFLRYRRRNVVIKYVPEDCSRLVQARATVHFNAVTERFTPHDTLFTIASPKELKDSALSAACSLHTASGSTSSSTSSLRRRRLMEIAEEAEEDIRAKRQSTVLEERASTDPASSDTPVLENSPIDLAEATSYKAIASDLGRSTSPPPPRENKSFEERPVSPTKTIDEPRKSSQSTRPEFYSTSSYGSNGKPKIKLGPRPSFDVNGKTHSSTASSKYRPVSTLPAGMKLFSRNSKGAKDRPNSQQRSDPESMSTSMLDSPPTEPTPTSPMSPLLQAPRPHTSGGRPNSSSSAASIKPLMSANINTPKMPKTSTITPEKARLMKAMELRKKKMSTPAPVASTESPSLSPSEDPEESVANNASLEEPKEVENAGDILDESSISFDANSTMKTEGSDATRSDSYPASPVAPSERAQSTKASSISESTDETVQDTHDLKDTADSTDHNSSDSTIGLSPERTIEQTPLQDPASNTETPSSEDLPHLLPMTYEPIPSPINVPKIYRKEDGDREKGETTEAYAEPHSDFEQNAVAGETRATTPTQMLEPEETQSTIETVPVSTEETSPQSEQGHVETATTGTEPEAPKPAEVILEHEQKPTNTAVLSTAEGSVEAEQNPEVQNVVLPPAELSMPAQEIPADDVSKIGSFIEAQSETTTHLEESKQPVISALTNTEMLEEPQDAEQEPHPVKIDVKEWHVPRSKFSALDVKKVVPVDHVSKQLSPDAMKRQSVATKAPIRSAFSEDANPTSAEEDDDSLPVLKKRKANIEPIRTDVDAERSVANSVANISSDDDLMDELQSAVFLDAQPITVSKSPISPVFPSPKKQERNRFSRAFSSSPKASEKFNSQLLSPPTRVPARAASASSAYLNRINQQAAAPMAKKAGLGGGIAQRIKALEKLQGSTVAATPTTGPPPGSSPAFFSVRRGSSRDSKAPSIAERATSLNRNSPSPSASRAVSRESSPEAFKLRERSGSVQSRLDVLSNPKATSTSRRESISVTARIIRDPDQPFPTKPELTKNPSEYAPLDLKQSPLVINHQKAINSPQKETKQERRLSTSSRTSKTMPRERRSSVTVVKDLISQGRASFSERRRSITIEPSSLPPSSHANSNPATHRPSSRSSRRSSSSRDVAISPPPMGRSSSTTSDEKEKKANRASRMLRRMSSSISAGRKTLTHARSPPLQEEKEPLSSPVSKPSATFNPPVAASIDIGHVNVQFPDTLLWKRRTMLLDSQGYLVVSPALTAYGNDRDKVNAGAIRRYHLSEFRMPVIPDIEMQELPNSVLLDFVEGGGLQVACEDRGGQKEVLNILQDAHRTWSV